MKSKTQRLRESILNDMFAGRFPPPPKPVVIDHFWVDDFRRCEIREGSRLTFLPKRDDSPLDLLVVRDPSLLIDVEAEGEGGLVDEIQHRLAELWIALVDTPADSLTPEQAEVRERLLTLFCVKSIEEIEDSGEGQ